jgi:hypothetical protein
MAVGVPQAVRLTCPREKGLRLFLNVSASTQYRCAGCEWFWTLATQAPTGTTNGSISAGGTAISVASGGASFTNGMVLLLDTTTSAEVVTVNGSATGVSIPITAAIRAHNSGATFGQLLASPSYNGFDMDAVPAAPGWGF